MLFIGLDKVGGWNALIEKVPEMFRPLVESMSVVDQLDWFTENAEKLGLEKTPAGIPETPAGKTPAEMSDEKKRKRAAKIW